MTVAHGDLWLYLGEKTIRLVPGRMQMTITQRLRNTGREATRLQCMRTITTFSRWIRQRQYRGDPALPGHGAESRRRA